MFIFSKCTRVTLPVKHLLTLLHSSCYQAQKTAPKGGFRIFTFQLICASGCSTHPHRNPQNPRHYALFTTLSRLFPSYPIFSFNSLRHSFAAATGTPTGIYDLAVAVVTAVVIVLAMNLVGSLLTSALIVFPTLSAMRVFKSYKRVVVCSAALSVFCAVFGILFSILASTPVGATIVVTDILAFMVFSAIGTFRRK